MNLNDPENTWKAAVEASEKRSYSSVANLHAANPDKPSMKELENLYMENIKHKKEQREAFKNAILHAPFFLCSTHGVYNLDNKIEPHIVPKNTWILEAQTIGDTLFTTIDPYVWELIQGPHREAFYMYIKNNTKWFEKYDTDTHKINPLFESVISNFILYKPGDTIYRRTIEIGGGRLEEKQGSERKTYGKGMGFCRFDASSPAYTFEEFGKMKPYEILSKLRTQMIENPKNRLSNYDLIIYLTLRNKNQPIFFNKNPIEQIFETAWPRNYDTKGPAVYIFSSCAGVTLPTKNEHRTRWTNVASLQAMRILEGWSMGLLGLGGGVPGPKLTLNELTSKLKNSTIIESSNSNDYQFTSPNNDLNLKMIYPEEEFGSMNLVNAVEEPNTSISTPPLKKYRTVKRRHSRKSRVKTKTNKKPRSVYSMTLD